MDRTVPGFSQMLHGSNYNPDQWLDCPEILRQDIELMKKAGMNCVCVGAFSWVRLEPEEGVFTFDWMEEIIDKLYQNGIYTILATPSGGKPFWMSENYEQIRRAEENGLRDFSGSGYNYCGTSPIYREKVQEIDRRLAEQFSHHPGVIAWRLSNEYRGGCFCPQCQQAFRGWLRRRYQTLDRLNQAWWTAVWSHTYTSWEQIQVPSHRGEHHIDGLMLDWNRFVTDQTLDFMKMERDTVKSVNPNLPVISNLMGSYEGLNYYKFGAELDLASLEIDPHWHAENNVDVAVQTAAVYDLTRSLKHENFLLMETTPSTTNWQPVSMLKRPGMHMLSAVQALAHGSNSVGYFQFRKNRGCQEKFHGAVVDHVGNSSAYSFVKTENTRVFRDVQRVGALLKQMNDNGDVAGTHVTSEAAIIYDVENRWAMEVSQGPRNKGIHYLKTVLNHYRSLWEKGIQVDIIDSECDLSGYRLVVAPMLYMIRKGFDRKLRNFVEQGGTLVSTYWSGIVDEQNLCIMGGNPGGLMDVFGIWNEETDSLPDGMYNSVISEGKHYRALELCARIHPITARVLGAYEKDFYAGEAAVTANSFGKGTAYYLAARTETDFLRDFYTRIGEKLQLHRALDTVFPEGVTAHERQGEKGNLIFVENYSDREQKVSLGRSLLDYRTRLPVSTVELPPFGVAILRKPTV